MNNQQTKRILVLEDDPMIGVMVEQSLIGAGYVVHLAEALPAALHLIDDLPFDAAILDYGSGSNTALQVAESLRIRQIPFVFCTAEEDVPAAFGDIPIVGKPFSTEVLVGVIRSVFGPPRHLRRPPS